MKKTKVTKVAYIRCNSGHYFTGEFCPLDNWSSAESKELVEAIGELGTTNHEISIESLQELGVSEATIRRTIVVDFGSNDTVFEAISPDGYVINGEWLPLSKASEDFL